MSEIKTDETEAKLRAAIEADIARWQSLHDACVLLGFMGTAGAASVAIAALREALEAP